MKRRSGFTLIEMLICVAIVGLMISIAMPRVEVMVKSEKERELRQALREIRMALDQYKQATDKGSLPMMAGGSGYPNSLNILSEGVVDPTSQSGKKLYFLRRLPRDPFYPDKTVDAAKTWGVRSYASPADDPKPGDDVFDVFSLSEGVALNGSRYRNW